MTIERRPWLALLCLPLLAATGTPLSADGVGGSTDDFLTVWQTFSDAARKEASSEASGATSYSPGLTAELNSGSLLHLLGVSPPGPGLAAGSVASTDNSEAPGGGLWEQPDKKPRKVSQKSQGLLGSLNTQVEVTDTPETTIWDEPSWKRAWQTDESWDLGVAGPLSVFGQVGAKGDEAGQSNMNLSGRTGLACKLPVGSLAELTVKSGPGVSYSDPLHRVRASGRSDWLVEVQARWPLLLGIGLEYQGSAMPSLTPLQQDMINQDVRLAIPVGSAGKFKVGAKRQWTGLMDQRTAWSDNTQLYLGLELSH